jgi:hypothetical protein
MRLVSRKGHPKTEKVWALEGRDLDALAEALIAAEALWKADHKSDVGTCVLGAGLATWYVEPRCRLAEQVILVRSPGQTDGALSRFRAEQYLRDQLPHLAVLFFDHGRMD